MIIETGKAIASIALYRVVYIPTHWGMFSQSNEKMTVAKIVVTNVIPVAIHTDTLAMCHVEDDIRTCDSF